MADEESKQAGKGFTVQDRRRFSPETGEVREDAPEQQAETQPKASEERRAPSGPSASTEALPEINFSTFVIGLSTQALMHLGDIANPPSKILNHRPPNLDDQAFHDLNLETRGVSFNAIRANGQSRSQVNAFAVGFDKPLQPRRLIA